MCGLAGIFDSRGERDIDATILSRMNASLRHRGPDGEGLYVGAGIGLAHRRLSIIDLERGQQPMFNEDRSVAVIYNGEIYNFVELKKELEAKGYRFKTHCDTEVIVHGWSAWGVDCVKRFRGMFAIALWDSEQRCLFLARDRLGEKPLYYAQLSNGMFIFGSELKALLEYPGLPRQIDVHAVEDYFAYGYIPDPKSIYKAVSKLPAAHTLLLRRGQSAEPQSYWDISFGDPREFSESSATEELIERLSEATQLRLISDVPLGAFLSGGVDSSAIVALMAGMTTEPVNTFSISFEDKSFDESAYAESVAKSYGTNHVTCKVDPDDYSLIDRLIEIYDEPFGDSSAMPTFKVCQVAREHVKVCLSGDGGDELFAGYRRYLWHYRESRIRHLLPSPVRRSLFGFLGTAYPKLDWAPQFLRAKTVFQELAMDEGDAYFNSVTVMAEKLRRRLFSATFRSELQGYEAKSVILGHMAAADTDHALLKAQYTDLKTWLPGDILVKVDRASMANSLEVRTPLLDHKLAEWAATLAPQLKLQGNTGKYIFKRALEPYLPREILYRPKQGFSVPLASWFRGALRQKVRDSITGPILAETGYFDREFLTRLVGEHEKGLRDHSPVLWLLLMFEAFVKRETGSVDATRSL